DDRQAVGAVGQGQLVRPAPEVDAGVVGRGAQGDDVGASAADERVDIADRAGVAAVVQGEGVVAAFEVDLHAGGQRGSQRDAIVPGAAGGGLGVGDGDGVAQIAQGQRVVAGAEVDAGVREHP